MSPLRHLLAGNREWAHRVEAEDPGFFAGLAHQQRPELLWIGCSDSRVPANEIVGLMPGEIFVHRNVANLVVHSDLNCLSVLQYGIDVLQVKHVIVCGHYGCGGIAAAVDQLRLGLVDVWLRHVREVAETYRDELESIDDPTRRAARLAELNVVAQVGNVCETTVVEDAWRRGQEVFVHGWIYDVADGLLRDLQVTRRGPGPA